jgi:hypothetical protein
MLSLHKIIMISALVFTGYQAGNKSKLDNQNKTDELIRKIQ